MCSVAQSCLTVTPWTAAHQAPLSRGFSRQEYWSGLPLSPPGDLPKPGIKPTSPVSSALQVDSLLSEGESHSVVSDSLLPHGLCSPWDSPGQNTGVGSLSHLQGIFPTQGSNPGLPHCRWILYQLSHKGIPRILEWVAYPSPADLPDPGTKLGSPATQADSLPTELSGKPSIPGVRFNSKINAE